MNAPDGVQARSTSIRFSVRVPVLSEQMTVTEPSVSTAGSLRTSALRRAMRRAPSASATVTTAGRPSGMAATARLTATRNIVSGDSPRATPAAKTSAQTTKASPASALPSVERRFWSGVWPPACSWRSSATRPRAVDIPVVTTMPRPRPYTTAVPLKATLRRSARTPSGTSGSASVDFSAGSDSPVSAASLIAQRSRLEEPQVGGHDVAGVEPDEVAGNDLGRRDEDGLAVTDRPAPSGSPSA